MLNWVLWTELAGMCGASAEGDKATDVGIKNDVGCANMFCMTCWSTLLFSFTFQKYFLQVLIYFYALYYVYV